MAFEYLFKKEGKKINAESGPLTLSDIKKNPDLLTCEIQPKSGETMILRPLAPDDAQALTGFLENLSEQTRGFYRLKSYDAIMVKEMCDAIGNYDKLRMVVTDERKRRLAGIFEYSFDIPDGDKERFRNYGIRLDSKTDCRMGPCMADGYQNRGLGSALFPRLIDIVRRFGKKRLILWGGVFEKNGRAINFYEKNGFRKLGMFENRTDGKSVDMIIDVN